jgi:hypothetical protein
MLSNPDPQTRLCTAYADIAEADARDSWKLHLGMQVPLMAAHGAAIIGVGEGPGIGMEALLHKLLGRFGEAVKKFKQISAKDRELASVTDIGCL